MAKAPTFLRMGIAFRVGTCLANPMAKVLTSGEMEPPTQVNSLKVRSQASEDGRKIHNLIVTSMRGNSWPI